MLSYDRLKPGLQTVFLDVAVMLMGADRKYAEWILQGARGRNAGSAHIDLDALIDLSLLECDASGSLRMHDTLADMARYIISQPGRSPVYLALDDRAGIQQDIEVCFLTDVNNIKSFLFCCYETVCTLEANGFAQYTESLFKVQLPNNTCGC